MHPATSATPVDASGRTAYPLTRTRPVPFRRTLLLWHLLSLDAPTVAAVWTLFIAASVQTTLPALVPFAMALAVWILYAADRLLDSRVLISQPRTASYPLPERDPASGLEARHLFHHRHRRLLLVALVLGSAVLGCVIPRLQPAALTLDLLLGSLLFAYFVLIHATGSAHRLPKEISVGLFFAAAVFIPTVARRPDLRLTLGPVALLFATLCSLNCLWIYRWEHDLPATLSRPHWLTRVLLTRLTRISLAFSVVGVLLALATRRPAPLAIAASSLLLLALDRLRNRCALPTLRALADLVLLTPLLVWPLLHLGR